MVLTSEAFYAATTAPYARFSLALPLFFFKFCALFLISFFSMNSIFIFFLTNPPSHLIWHLPAFYRLRSPFYQVSDHVRWTAKHFAGPDGAGRGRERQGKVWKRKKLWRRERTTCGPRGHFQRNRRGQRRILASKQGDGHRHT